MRINDENIDQYEYNNASELSSSKYINDDIAINEYIKIVFNRMRRMLNRNNFLQFLINRFPIFKWIPRYNFKFDFISDLICGLTLAIINIPQGLAYGLLAGLHASNGLYVSCIPAFIYFIFGTSRHLSIGTFAIIALMVGSVVESDITNHYYNQNILIHQNYTMDDARNKVSVSLNLFVGFFYIFFSIFRLGSLVNLISPNVIFATISGCSFVILNSQLKNFLGIHITPDKINGDFSVVKNVYYIAMSIHQTNISSLVISIVSTIMLISIKFVSNRFKNKIKYPIPAELIIIIIITGCSYGYNFKQRFITPIMDHVPSGLPPISIPDVSLITNLWTSALLISLISFAVNISLAIDMSEKHNYRIDINQELLAYGLCNVFSSFFTCFPSSGSLIRSLIVASIGKTQLSTLISSVVLLIISAVAASLFNSLPKAVLASVIFVNLFSTFFNITKVKNVYIQSKIEFIIWVITFLSTVIIGIQWGFIIGILSNCFYVFYHLLWPKICSLQKVESTSIFVKTNNKYEVDNELSKDSNLFIISQMSPLLYLNCKRFFDNCQYHIDMLIEQTSNDDQKYPRQKLDSRTEILYSKEPQTVTNATQYEHPNNYYLIIDLSYNSFVDICAVSLLEKIISYGKSKSVEVLICYNTNEVLSTIMKNEPKLLNSLYPSLMDCWLYVKKSPLHKNNRNVSELNF